MGGIGIIGIWCDGRVAGIVKIGTLTELGLLFGIENTLLGIGKT